MIEEDNKLIGREEQEGRVIVLEHSLNSNVISIVNEGIGETAIVNLSLGWLLKFYPKIKSVASKFLKRRCGQQ